MVSIEVASTTPAALGEGPVWSADEQVLYWVDIEGKAIRRYNPSTGADDAVSTPARPGSFALTTDPGKMLVATEHEAVWFDWHTGDTQPFVQLEKPGARIRMNDGRTDPAGRFVVGSMYEDTGAHKYVGSLHQIEADGTVTALRRAVGVSNGLAYDTDRGIMYWADSPTEQVLAWDFDAETGARSNERVFFDYAAVEGKPDGACTDADGYYWSASVRGWAVTRIAPDGTVDRRIDLPVHMPSMTCLGGPNLDVLFITSIDNGPTDDERAKGVPPGSLLAIDLSAEGITGVLDAKFAGTHPGDSPS